MGHGGMNNQLKAARLILILVNVIIFLIGATLIGEGIELLITRRLENFSNLIPKIENFLVTKNTMISDEILYIIIIIFGTIFICLGFFGCSGIITQIRCLLYCYFYIISIILVFQTTIIISLVCFRIKLKQKLLSIIHLSLRKIYKGPLEENLPSISIFFDWIMYHFQCCGIENKNDFNITINWNRTNPWWNNSMSIEHKNFQYPLTCCPMNNTFHTDSIVFNRILSCAINGSYIHETSCYEKIFDSIRDIILIISIFIILIEIFALIFILVIINRNQIQRISHVIEQSPPSYSPRTRINNTNLYFQI